MRLLKPLFIVLCSIASFCSLAQQEGVYTKIGQTVGPSPTAASLGTYGNYPVSNFTGVPDISIPLIDVELKDFHLPIALRNNPGGIKVEDMGSWVGTGWSLDAGGVVTRSVVDVPDDQLGYPLEGASMPCAGWLYYNWYKAGYNPPLNGNSLNICFDPQATAPQTIFTVLDYMRNSRDDTEPDIFVYNFGGQTGKFFFPMGGGVQANSIATPQLVPYRDIKISYNIVAPTSESSGEINQFTIKDSKGNTYIFGAVDTSSEYTSGTTDYCQGCSGSGQIGDVDGGDMSSNTFTNSFGYRSAWYVTQIITANTDTINFTYASENYHYNAPTVWNGRIHNNFSLDITDAQACALSPTSYWSNYVNPTISVTGKRLSTITGPNFKVEFDPGANRADLLGAYTLGGVKLYSINAGVSTLVKQFGLTYHWMADVTQPLLPGGFGDTRQHLILDTIYNKDANGVVVSNYNFGYYDSIPLPDRITTQEDFWGFFCQNHCANNFPKIYIHPDAGPVTEDVPSPAINKYSIFPDISYEGLTFILPGVDRSTNASSILSGTIKSIQFPTKGTTSFTFEPHSFFYGGINRQGGGLRLRQSVSYDGVSHANDIVHNYSYYTPVDTFTSSGILFNLPSFAYAENAYNEETLNPGAQPIGFSQDDINYWQYNLVRSNVPQSTLNGFDGINVGYQYIVDVQPGNGKTIKTYSVPGAYGTFDDDPNDGYCTVGNSGFCDYYFQAPSPTTIYNYPPTPVNPNPPYPPLAMDMTGLDGNIPYTFPFAPLPNYDWDRGIILNENDFDVNNNPVKTVNYHYTLFTPGNSGVQFIKGLKKGRLMNYGMMLANGYYSRMPDNSGFSDYGYSGGLAMYDVIEPYQVLTQVAKVPSSRATYLFDQTTAHPIADSVVYAYGYNNVLPAVETHFESDGSSTIAHNKYIADIDTTQAATTTLSQGYYNMKRNNLVEEPVEQYTQVSRSVSGTNTVAAKFFTYKPSLIKQDSTLRLATAQPLSNFSPAVIAYNGLSRDSRYEPYVLYDSYDGRGNALQLHKYEDYPVSYVWDYNHQYIVATVENAIQSDVAYTSFEADGQGNWTIPGYQPAGPSGVTGLTGFFLSASGAISKPGLNSATSYVVSYWTKNSAPFTVSGTLSGYPLKGKSVTVKGDVWTYYEHKVSSQTTVTVNGTGYIDELRLYPANAQMVTYTYAPQIGMTSKCNEESQISYYEYDSFGRPKDVKDFDGNIIKIFQYHYQGN